MRKTTITTTYNLGEARREIFNARAWRAYSLLFHTPPPSFNKNNNMHTYTLSCMSKYEHKKKKGIEWDGEGGREGRERMWKKWKKWKNTKSRCERCARGCEKGIIFCSHWNACSFLTFSTIGMKGLDKEAQPLRGDQQEEEEDLIDKTLDPPCLPSITKEPPLLNKPEALSSCRTMLLSCRSNNSKNSMEGMGIMEATTLPKHRMIKAVVTFMFLLYRGLESTITHAHSRVVYVWSKEGKLDQLTFFVSSSFFAHFITDIWMDGWMVAFCLSLGTCAATSQRDSKPFHELGSDSTAEHTQIDLE